MAGLTNQPMPPLKPADTAPKMEEVAILVDPEGFNQHDKYIYNLPQDKVLCWRGPMAAKKGHLADWQVYTEEHLKKDAKLFGTRLARPYRLEENRMVIGISWLVFRSMELHQRQEAARVKREQMTMQAFPSGQRGKVRVVDKGKERMNYSQEARED